MQESTREFLLEADGYIFQALSDLFDKAYWGGHEDLTFDYWECLDSRESILAKTNRQIGEQIAEAYKAGFIKGIKYSDSEGSTKA